MENITIESWIFPVAREANELVKAIESFDEYDFAKRIEAHHRTLGSYEGGMPTNRACDLVMSHHEIYQ